MKHLLFVALVGLTSLNGTPVWVAASEVVSVRAPTPGPPWEFPRQCRTVVTTVSNTFCVTEQPAEVVDKLEKAK